MNGYLGSLAMYLRLQAHRCWVLLAHPIVHPDDLARPILPRRGRTQ